VVQWAVGSDGSLKNLFQSNLLFLRNFLLFRMVVTLETTVSLQQKLGTWPMTKSSYFDKAKSFLLSLQIKAVDLISLFCEA